MYLQRESVWDKSTAWDITPTWIYPTFGSLTYKVLLGGPQADGVLLEFVGVSIVLLGRVHT